MTDWEKTIAEIREALKKASSWGLKSTPWIVVNAPEWLRFLLFELDREREENQKLCEQLQSAQQDRDKLIEGLRSFINEVDQKEDEAWKKWEKEADMYFQGASYAFDFVQAKLRDILKEIGVTVDV